MHPLISVIVPVYNTAPFLARCLDSLAVQTYPNMEFVLVDDGSTDGSIDICENYAAADTRFRVIRASHGGQSSARNHGLTAAKGEFVGFVDSDDEVLPDFFSALYRSIEQTESDIAECGYCRRQNGKDHPVLPPHRILQGEEILSALYRGQLFSGVCNKLYRASLWDGVCFASCAAFEDEATLPLVFEKATRLVTVSVAGYLYDVREGSVMTALSVARGLEGFAAVSACDRLIVSRHPSLETEAHLHAYWIVRRLCVQATTGAVWKAHGASLKQAMAIVRTHQKDIRSVADFGLLGKIEFFFIKRKSRLACRVCRICQRIYEKRK